MFAMDYFDGPLNGLARRNGRLHYFAIAHDSNDEDRVRLTRPTRRRHRLWSIHRVPANAMLKLVGRLRTFGQAVATDSWIRYGSPGHGVGALRSDWQRYYRTHLWLYPIIDLDGRKAIGVADVLMPLKRDLRRVHLKTKRDYRSYRRRLFQARMRWQKPLL